MRSDIAPGGTFPDYELPDHTNILRKLSELQGEDPLILTLARGHYCPKEHQQHLDLAAFYPKVAVAYTQMATISTDAHHELQEFRASVGAQWTFLSDPGRTIQKDLDIQEYTDPEHDPMIPHTLVLKPGLVIHSVYNGYWFWGRPSVYDLWRDLSAATSEIRPDWDLSAPGLRDAWNAGDLSPFHGWNKRPEEAGASPDARVRQAAASEDAARSRTKAQSEFLVEFEVTVPDGTPESEVSDRQNAEAAAAAKLAHEGHLVRVWKPTVPDEPKVLGLYRADSEAQLADLLRALPIYEWMRVTVTPLEPHPNDPAATGATYERSPA